MQKVFSPGNNYKDLKEYMRSKGVKRPLLVCGNSFDKLPLVDIFDFEYTRFSGFSPNPLYEQCMDGVRVYKESKCDGIIAVGGGSAMDVAKCIRYFSAESGVNMLSVPLVAIPTTAGTGSESTRFAVIYKNGEKISVEDELCYPDGYVLDYKLLLELPRNQRIATMLDALSHGIESLWSVNSIEESFEFSKEAIKQVLENKEAYLCGNPSGEKGMLNAANIAGQAINITKTTAGHAMCYKLTTLYGIPHGLAAAICIWGLLPFMRDNIDRCIDKRGKEFLIRRLDILGNLFGCDKFSEFVGIYDSFIKDLGINIQKPTDEEYRILADSVNVQRLGNHPIEITKEDILDIYSRIFEDM